MQSLRASLKQYEIEHPKRSTGGLYSLSGFDFQLRVYLADLVESLSNEQSTPLMEAFSDITAETDSGIVITQVKRTLSRKSLREAADEIAVLYEFLQTRQPDLPDSIRFQVVGAGKNKELATLSEATWASVEVPINPSRPDDTNLTLRHT